MTGTALQAASSQPASSSLLRFPSCSPVLPGSPQARPLGRRPERARRARRARRCCRTTCAWSPRPPPRPPSSCRTPRGARRLAPAAPGAPPRPGRPGRALASCARLGVPERAGAHGRSAGAHGAMRPQRFKRMLLWRTPVATGSLRLGVAASRGAAWLRPLARAPSTQRSRPPARVQLQLMLHATACRGPEEADAETVRVGVLLDELDFPGRAPAALWGMQRVSWRGCQLVQSSPRACAAAGHARNTAGSQRHRALSGSHHWGTTEHVRAASMACAPGSIGGGRLPSAAASGRAARQSALTCEAQPVRRTGSVQGRAPGAQPPAPAALWRGLHARGARRRAASARRGRPPHARAPQASGSRTRARGTWWCSCARPARWTCCATRARRASSPSPPARLTPTGARIIPISTHLGLLLGYCTLPYTLTLSIGPDTTRTKLEPRWCASSATAPRVRPRPRALTRRRSAAAGERVGRLQGAGQGWALVRTCRVGNDRDADNERPPFSM